MCKILKKFSNQIQPYSEVADVIDEIRCAPQNISWEIRILKHLLSYAEFQFGDRIQGNRKKQDGECISNWDVDVNYLLPIHGICLEIYEADMCERSLSMMLIDNLRLPHAEKMLEILSLWSVRLESNDCLDRDQTNLILKLSAGAEQRLASIYKNRNQFSLAEDHLNLALSYARQYEEEGEEKTNLLVGALINNCDLRGTRGDYTGAVTFAEEAYTIAAVTYNPVHPRVQDAAGRLIQSMTHAGDLIQAETYAQMTLDSLRDPANNVDPEGVELACGYYHLAKVTSYLDKDQPKAEMLIRESLRIRTKYFGNDHQCVMESASLLSYILVSQGKLGDET
jgi:tetratricopeptide (TPR) repeat protein